MFELSPAKGRGRWSISATCSVAVHFAVLVVLCLRPAPIFVQPAMIAHGDRGQSPLIYLAAPGPEEVLVAKQAKPRPAQITLPVPAVKQFNAKVTSQKATEPQNTETVSATTSGSPFGSDLNGYATGPDVRPAIEQSLVDPQFRVDVPSGVDGDVIVEVTIDEHGGVIATKLLKGVGFGIDEKILATVRSSWHYTPATKDGVPIPSKQDARWHVHG